MNRQVSGNDRRTATLDCFWLVLRVERALFCFLGLKVPTNQLEHFLGIRQDHSTHLGRSTPVSENRLQSKTWNMAVIDMFNQVSKPRYSTLNEPLHICGHHIHSIT